MRLRPVRTLAVVVAATAGACGIPRDRVPTVIPGGVVNPAVAPEGGEAAAEPKAAVFLVQAEHLVKVVRNVPSNDLLRLLERLLGGPKQAEFAAGLRTAISPQTTLRSARVDGDTAVVDLSSAFVEVGGQEQILAVAQIVLTATTIPGVAQVRFLLEGQAVDIPRADGTLTSEPLRPGDYERLLQPSP